MLKSCPDEKQDLFAPIGLRVDIRQFRDSGVCRDSDSASGIHASRQRSNSKIAVVSKRDGQLSATAAKIKLTSSNESIVRIRDGVAYAIGDGSAAIIATDKKGNQSEASVKVVGTSRQHEWSFRNDVQSILARAGCNAGACHGALAGKGGFRLSLRGYDSQADYLAITREARGRRIEIGNPAQSLILAKPTGALPHKGGLKLDTESREYRILAEWITRGAAPPTEDDPRLEKIGVLPESALLSPGDNSQVLVQAHYDDGRVIDVTHWSQFSATDEAVATVNQDGQVTVQGSGESAVLVWFGSKVALARMTVPFGHKLPDTIFTDAPRRNFIDEHNLTQLKTLQLKPSPRCDDETFLRRATLDTTGRLPTLVERDKYLEHCRRGTPR